MLVTGQDFIAQVVCVFILFSSPKSTMAVLRRIHYAANIKPEDHLAAASLASSTNYTF
jgi:hypothetical protein